MKKFVDVLIKSEDIKYWVCVKVYDNVYWVFNLFVGAGVGRGVGNEVDSKVGNKFDEVFEL